MNTLNPYAPPKARVEDIVQTTSEADAIRREHIRHEASVRSIGVLYYLGGGALCLAAIGFLSFYASGMRQFAPVIGVLYLGLGILDFFIAHAIRKLRPWARTALVVLSFIGLLGFPLGTLINGYILYLLLSQKGRRLFEADYPEIVAATPDVKYRTPIAVWIVLGALLLLIVVGVVVARFAAIGR